MSRINVLFICGRNKRRSPTAAYLYRNDRRLAVRAAGLGDTSPRRVTEDDIKWAHLILPMERKNAKRLQIQFSGLDFPSMETLDIQDDYTYMDKALIPVLHAAVEAALAKYLEDKEGK
jgi:protein-tyrosine phosphatase